MLYVYQRPISIRLTCLMMTIFIFPAITESGPTIHQMQKKDGVCIYFKNSLPLKVLDIQLLQECINFEIKIADKICNFIFLYRSPSQSKGEFESFADNLELNLDSFVHKNPYLIVVLGDFNAQTKGWYPLGKTT